MNANKKSNQNKQTELNKFLNWIRLSNKNIITICDACNAKETTRFANFIGKSKFLDTSRKQPDFVAITPTLTIAFEHFEFDSYKQASKNKGSKAKIEEAEHYRNDIQSLIKKDNKEITDVNNYTYSVSPSMIDYEENVIRQFVKHYSKVDTYIKETMKLPSTKHVEVCFIIENSSFLPDFIYKATERMLLLPFYSKAFMNIVINSPKVKHIIYAVNEEQQQKLYYLCNKAPYNEFVSKFKTIDNNEWQMVNWKTHEISTIITVPKELIPKWNKDEEDK